MLTFYAMIVAGLLFFSLLKDLGTFEAPPSAFQSKTIDKFKLIDPIVFIGSISIFIWIILAIFYPIYFYNFDIEKSLNSYREWQTFNAAMIALTASLIAYSATTIRYNSEKARSRRTAYSKLPAAASELADYTKEVIDFYSDIIIHFRSSATMKSIPTPPSEPSNYSSTFDEASRYGDDELNVTLQSIRNRLQILSSIIKSDYKGLTGMTSLHVGQSTLEGHLVYAATIAAMSNRLFNYGRPNCEITLGPYHFKEIAQPVEISNNGGFISIRKKTYELHCRELNNWVYGK